MVRGKPSRYDEVPYLEKCRKHAAKALRAYRASTKDQYATINELISDLHHLSDASPGLETPYSFAEAEKLYWADKKHA